MRSTKELLEILLEQYKNNKILMIQEFGLCWAIVRLYSKNLISLEECDILTDYLYSNKPEWAWAGYWWTMEDVPPRIKFLKQLISRL